MVVATMSFLHSYEEEEEEEEEEGGEEEEEYPSPSLVAFVAALLRPPARLPVI